jgi:FAD/FMN-containing dehydrogenase
MSHQSQSNNFKAALFSDGFTGDVVIPGDPQYAASLTRFAKNAKRNAALVAFVKSAEDVSRVIKFVNSQSSATGTPIHTAIRGGGHSAAGTSSSEGGVVIDLSRHVNTVRVDEEKKLAYVGGGAIWEAVDKEAIKFDLAAPGGTVNHTGVGGSVPRVV